MFFMVLLQSVRQCTPKPCDGLQAVLSGQRLGCQFKSHYSASCACELLTHRQPVGFLHSVGNVIAGQQRVGVVHVNGVLDSVPKAVVPDASASGLVD